MQVHYDEILRDFDGTPFKLEGDKPLTIKDVILACVRNNLPGDDALSPMDKFSVGEIGHLANKGMDLTTEQVSKVKDRCGKMFAPALIFDLFTKLESAPKDKPVKRGKE